MNKQELIKRIEDLPYTEGPIADTIEINRNWILKSIEQLAESEIGHADEAPRYVKNILARLRELPLHDREVWLKAIMSKFEQDFSHAKWREGYEQGKIEGMVEREKVIVPQCVAEYIEFKKKNNFHVYGAMRVIEDHYDKKVPDWFYENNIEKFCLAWLDGYEVEEEKRYLVTLKNRQPLVKSQSGSTLYFSQDITARNYKGTQKELEDAKFGWVFDCEGIDIEEVE
ncbi:phage protein [Streptococcus pneumoniae]|nr:phage protein [Streptococcus pneumoniae]VSK55198.1 phage protein [Streptococcus pneumoniae]